MGCGKGTVVSCWGAKFNAILKIICDSFAAHVSIIITLLKKQLTITGFFVSDVSCKFEPDLKFRNLGPYQLSYVQYMM